MINNELITLSEARKIAEEMSLDYVSDFMPPSISCLDSFYLEAEFCWMFFRNREITLPEERTFGVGAYIVSKKGNARYIADFYDEPLQCKEYLQTMSNFFRDSNQ